MGEEAEGFSARKKQTSFDFQVQFSFGIRRFRNEWETGRVHFCIDFWDFVNFWEFVNSWLARPQ